MNVSEKQTDMNNPGSLYYIDICKRYRMKRIYKDTQINDQHIKMSYTETLKQILCSIVPDTYLQQMYDCDRSTVQTMYERQP